MRDVVIGEDGAAVGSDRFVVCPAAFNAYVAFNARELGATVDDSALLRDADELARLIDELLWDEDTGLWADRPVVGGDGRTHRIPISDGAMPLLVTDDREHAQRALATLIDPQVFGGTPFGPTNVARDQPSYDPAAYWRGAAWPNMSYLLWLAARRWRRHPGRRRDRPEHHRRRRGLRLGRVLEPAHRPGTGSRSAVLDRARGDDDPPGAGVTPDDAIPVLEVGGTHVTAVLVAAGSWELVPGSLRTVPLDADGTAAEIWTSWPRRRTACPEVTGRTGSSRFPVPSTTSGGSGCSATSASSTASTGSMSAAAC